MSLTKVQKARIKWLKGLGLRIGSDFEVEESGVFLYILDDHISWQNLASSEVRSMIAEMVRDNGAGEVPEYDAETRAALNEDHILSMVNDHIGSAGEDNIMEEVVAAQLEARIEPMIEVLAQEEVVMEPAAEVEEALFTITNTGATGVALSKRLRQEIAEKVKKVFRPDDLGADVVEGIHWFYQGIFGPEHDARRAAWACSRYAAAVVRSLNRQTQNGPVLKVNTYWA